MDDNQLGDGAYEATFKDVMYEIAKSASIVIGGILLMGGLLYLFKHLWPWF